MMSASMSILRRLVSQIRCTSASADIIGRPNLIVSQIRRKLCTSASAEIVRRPNLILQPCLAQGKVEYNFYSPLKKGIVRFNNRSGDDKEVDLIKNKSTNWVGSSHGWVVLFEHGGSYNMCLLNPLSGRRIELPPFPFSDKEEHNYPFKVTLSHSPDEQDCRALMIFGSRDRAAVCSLGGTSQGCWSPLGPHLPRFGSYKDFGSYNDFVYSTSRRTFVSARMEFRSRWWKWAPKKVWDELEFWDASEMVKVKTVTVPRNSFWREPGFIWQTYLVLEEESDGLFMVRRFYNGDDKDIGYIVYSIRSDDSDVRLCKSLGGLVMFIGKNHGFAVRASKYPEFKANAIYFCGNWPNENQQADTFYYDHTKAYSQKLDFAPHQNFQSTSNYPPMFTFPSD